MLAKFAENSYLDVDLISFITGEYPDKDIEKWTTYIVISGIALTIGGEPGKNILDAYLFKNWHSIYNYVKGTEQYQKQNTGPLTKIK